MSNLRFGIVGIGNMGTAHAKNLLNGDVKRAELGAICDVDPRKREGFPGVRHFERSEEMIRSGKIDAILVATPHYDHTTIGIDALEQGLHTLIEKPISVHKADCERLIAAHKNPDQVFGAMFNQRTDRYYQKIRHLVQSGELGEVRRINWIITNWFRSEAYYASGGWRATWAGEGGGVLLNQCPHNLDLFQWIFGMPSQVRAWCRLGHYHDIEVEDDVTAYLEYSDGKSAVFITSTGEAPGTNRLEITAERGKLVYENDKITFTRNETPTGEWSRTTTSGFSTPETWDVQIGASGHGGQHVEILQNFTDAVLDGKPLLAPAEEGIHSVELANAMLFSSLEDRAVEMPLDGAAFANRLRQLIANSKFEKKVVESAPAEDFSKSFR